MKTETKAARKFRLFARLSEMGFTFDEATSLYKIQLTLNRWSVAECNGEIVRDETTEKPSAVSRAYLNGPGTYQAWPSADREAGALRRLRAILTARNEREHATGDASPHAVTYYHQGDPRGCSLYLVRLSDLPQDRWTITRDGANGWGASEKHTARVQSYPTKREAQEYAARQVLSSYYNTHGVAVCV